jgi:hypothetical protein
MRFARRRAVKWIRLARRTFKLREAASACRPSTYDDEASLNRAAAEWVAQCASQDTELPPSWSPQFAWAGVTERSFSQLDAGHLTHVFHGQQLLAPRWS